MTKTLNVFYKIIMGSLIAVIIMIALASFVGMEIKPFSLILGGWIVLVIVVNVVYGLYRLIRSFNS